MLKYKFETWTIKKEEEICFKMWLWKMIAKIKLIEKIRNKAVLKRIEDTI